MKVGQKGNSSHCLPKEEKEEARERKKEEKEEKVRHTIPNLVEAVEEDEDEGDEHDERQSELRNWDPVMRQSRIDFRFQVESFYA